MEWCLDCHRNPGAEPSAAGEVFDVKWQPPPDQADRGRKLAEQYQHPRRPVP